MTPSELAELVWAEFNGEHARFVRPLREAIAEQIRVAVSEEREACAREADARLELLGYPEDAAITFAKKLRNAERLAISDAIRARK